MKNADTENRCEKLEERAYLNGDSFMNEWKKHAESCPECTSKIELVNNISESIDELDLTLGKQRLQALEKALKEERKTPHFRYLYKYAAAAALILISFIITVSIQPKQGESQQVADNNPEVMENPSDPELAWDSRFDKRKARLNVVKLNRFREDSRRESLYLNRFKKRCRATKSKISRLRDKEIFM